MPPLRYLIPAGLLMLAYVFAGCRSPESDGLYIIPLTDNLRTSGSGNYQIYYGVADTARWEATVAAADTIAPLGERQFKIRSGGIWYMARVVKGELRAAQEYPGWERRVDSVSRGKNIVRLLDNERVVVSIPSAQVVLGGDSITIGLMRVVDRAFEWQDFPVNHPDYLVLLPKGEEVAYIAMDSDNVGPIGRQTVFRVGRRYYVLKAVSDSFSSLTVEEMPHARGMDLTAELDTYYKQIPVQDLDGNPAGIRRTPGRDLAVYFFALGGNIPEYVLEVDSLYRSLPETEKEKLDIALVARYAFPDSLRSFVDRHNVQLPVYKATEKTCRRLNCTAYLPSFIGVNERGRIVTFQGRHVYLEEKLRGMLSR